VCFDFVSLLPFGADTLITLGLARVDTIRKKSRRMNKISFNASVCTLAPSLNFFLRFITMSFVVKYYFPNSSFSYFSHWYSSLRGLTFGDDCLHSSHFHVNYCFTQRRKDAKDNAPQSQSL